MTQFKAGDLVRIKENAREIMEPIGYGVYKYMEPMVGKTLTIASVSDTGCHIYTEDKTTTFFFPLEALEPVEDLKVTGFRYRPNITAFDEVENNADKGFNPEKLTFDGVEIKEGDGIDIGDQSDQHTKGRWTVRTFGQYLCIDVNEFFDDPSRHTLPLHCFNIVAHYPAKDKELERLQSEQDKAYNDLMSISNSHYPISIVKKQKADRYYQARLALDNYKAKNG
jgi:hypothetical protein